MPSSQNIEPASAMFETTWFSILKRRTESRRAISKVLVLDYEIGDNGFQGQGVVYDDQFNITLPHG